MTVVLALAACATDYSEPSPAVLRAKWEAGNVVPTNYRAEMLAYLRTYLNDPRGIRDAAISEPALKPVVGGDRYVVCVRFSAKRPYAGMATFVAGKLDRFTETRGEVRNEACRDAAYVPFPELERLSR